MGCDYVLPKGEQGGDKSAAEESKGRSALDSADMRQSHTT
jgi:hypothetical protein